MTQFKIDVGFQYYICCEGNENKLNSNTTLNFCRIQKFDILRSFSRIHVFFCFARFVNVFNHFFSTAPKVSQDTKFVVNTFTIECHKKIVNPFKTFQNIEFLKFEKNGQWCSPSIGTSVQNGLLIIGTQIHITSNMYLHNNDQES